MIALIVLRLRMRGVFRNRLAVPLPDRPHSRAICAGAVGNAGPLAARLGGDNRAAYAEPAYLRPPTTIDPKMWACYHPGGLSVTFTRGRNKGRIVESYLSVEDADEDNVEGYASGGGGAVSIASIDTGVQMDHPEFGGVTFVAGRDFVSDDDDPSDENDHGTHTTGTMVGDNGGVAGVAFGARPLPSPFQLGGVACSGRAGALGPVRRALRQIGRR